MKIKYIAAGFLEDAGKLLHDFLELNSFEFSAFASVWKQHHFSLVYMGRPEDIELTEFTNEIFRISSQFLSTSSVLFQIGAIFLLYGLYRNQISVPPIKIRIEMSQWKVILAAKQEAIVKKYQSLHYVIDYLISNAFIFVAHQSLRGPVIASVQKVSKSSENVSNIRANYKIDLSEYSCSSNLVTLNELQNEYLEIKKSLNSSKVSTTGNGDIFQEFLGEIEIVLNSTRPTRRGRGRGRKYGMNIGLRRSEIKAAAFSKKSVDFWGRNAESEDCPDSDDNLVPSVRPVTYRRRRVKRVPQHQRRVGRPRKIPLPQLEEDIEEVNDDIDITHLLKQQEEFYLPPELSDRGRIRTVRFPYYKLLPKPEIEKGPLKKISGAKT